MTNRPIAHRLAAARAVQSKNPDLTERQCFNAVDALDDSGLLRDSYEWQTHTSAGNHLTMHVHEKTDGAVSCACEWDIESAAAAAGYGFMAILTLCRDIAAAQDGDLTAYDVLRMFYGNTRAALRHADENLSNESVQNIPREDSDEARSDFDLAARDRDAIRLVAVDTDEDHVGVSVETRGSASGCMYLMSEAVLAVTEQVGGDSTAAKLEVVASMSGYLTSRIAEDAARGVDDDD